MVCGCDRIIITDSRVLDSIDERYLANDGNLYLDLSTSLTFTQIDSLVELDPLGDMKTEAVFGGSVPQTDKNYVILNRFVAANQKEQNPKPLSVLAMNGHKALNVTNLSVIYFDESSKAYELELTRGDDHWAVCAANLKLNTLDLETYEFSKELITESWNNYIYEEGDQGIYFPLANYGAQFRQDKWTVEDFRPAHSIPHLLRKGFCQCGWDFSSPVFDTDIGNQLWLYCLGEDYGKEPDALEAMKFHAFATKDTTTKLGNDNLVSIYNDSAKSYFKGDSKYYIRFEIDKIWFPEQFKANIITEVHIIISKTSPSDPYFKEEIETINVEYPQDTPPNAGQDPQTLLIEWDSKISTSTQDNILVEIQYSSFQIDHAPISDLDIPYEFTYYNEPIRTIYKRGDTVDIAKIISDDLTLLKLLKGTVHLFGQAKIYINNATKEMVMYPPFKSKWNEEEIEGFFKYDEVINLSEDILCDTTKITAPELTTSRYNIVGYKTTRNPKVQEYLEENNIEHLHARNVDFGSNFTDETEEVLNPVFEPVLNAKLIKPSPPRPPLLFESTSDGIDCMWLVDNLDGNMSYDIGFVPFIAYGSYGNYGESISTNFLTYSFFFETGWEDTPVSGQLLGGGLNNGGNLEVIEPALVYGENPLKDLFSTFWREEFYRRALSSTIDISVNFKSNQLAILDYRKLFFIQYQEGFAAWLNTRNFNYCSPEGTKLTFVPDLSIEPECIDPDTIPPVESCEEVNDPEIQYEIDENCMVTYSQVGTIESNVTSEQWLIRYEDESTFSNAPASPFKPENNFYLRYTAETDSELCSIPTRTEYITICQINEFELEVLYDSENDCYRVNTLITGCNEYSDVQFYTKAKTDPDVNYVEVEPENPSDDPDEYYIEICEPEDNFCIKVVPTISAGCEIDEVIECVNLCPTSDDVICEFLEVDGGFNFNPNTDSIHRMPTSELYEYDLDSQFSNPTEFSKDDTLNLVGRYYFRVTLTFEDCDPVVKVCENVRDSNNCSANKPDFQCNVQSDGRLIIEKTGTLVSDPVLDRIAYSRSLNGHWIDYNGEKLSDCPIYVKRNIIFCNDCPPICVPPRLCSCSADPNPEPFECADFSVVLKRYQGELYAEVPFTTSGMVFIFYKDGVEIQNSASNTITLSGEDGTYRVKAIFQDCEDQDDFVYDSGCEPPELSLVSKTNDDMTYSYVFDVDGAGANPQFTVYLDYQTGEATRAVRNISYTYDEGLERITFDSDLEFGENIVVVTVENACGTDIISNTETIDCPTNDTGESTIMTICEGCLSNEDAIDYLGGTPDSGGEWFDLSSSEELENDGSINFHLLGIGTYEFLYTFNASSDLCRRSSQLTVQVIERKTAGSSVIVDLCHDAGETELFSLIPDSPDSGGSWYSDSTIDGDLDLVNGTIAPADTDKGKQVIISYTHDPEVTDGCNCLEYSILTINILDCTPPPACEDDDDLGISIVESTNGSPSDAQWEDKLTASKTGSYANAAIIDTDDIYYSNDDGATWTKATTVEDDDYYVKMNLSFTTSCNNGAQTSIYKVYNVTLSNGDNVDEATLTSGNGTFNNSWTNISSGDNLEASGASSQFFANRFFRWDVRHTLNSGWVIPITYTVMIKNSGDGQACAPGGTFYADRYNSGARSGKRKILFERRVTYNNGCAPLTIEGEFNPELPDCVEGTPSGVGFSITKPVDLGGGSYYSGYVRCSGSVAGSTSDTIRVYEQYSGTGGYARTIYTCGAANGSNNDLAINNSYFFVRTIEFADCPPIILLHNYQAPVGCSTAGISCSKEDANSRARAVRSSTPSSTASDYLQYKIGSGGTWYSYTEGQWVYVTGTQTVYFRRVANYNNGCSQTTSSCSITVSPPVVTITNTCSGGDTVNTSLSGISGGGTYRVFKNGTFVYSSSSNSYLTTDVGTYRVEYVKDGQTYVGNAVSCGSSSGGGCVAPTVAVGSCQISGTSIVLPFSTSNITSSSQIAVSSSAGTGIFLFNGGTGQGTVEIDGEVGQAHTITVTVTNDCGTDNDSQTCTLGCSTLLFDNVVCDFDNGYVTYDVLLSPDGGGTPTSNGTYLSKPSAGRYRYRYTNLTGTLTADHALACSSISQAISCECDAPIIDLNMSCTNNGISYSFTVANESSVNGNYRFVFDNNPALTFVVPNTLAGSYSGNWGITGLSHTYKMTYEACGEDEEISGSMTCTCANPSITLSASCDTDEVDISFTVTNEGQATSNYSVLINGAIVKTITKTGAGTYTDTISVTSGTNNTVQIRVNSACGGQISSNTASANCLCPSSSLSISDVSCDSETQMLTFDVNLTNIIGALLKVNGVTKTITGNPMSIQGVIGSNTIELIGEDSCSGDDLSDIVNYSCGCDLPSMTFSATCNTSGVISWTLVVTDEDRIDGNYTILRDGSPTNTITNTGAGTYNGTINVTAGTSRTMRVTADNLCGGTTQSNQINVTCGCPSSSLSIDSVSCNASNQNITFSLNRTNVNNLVLKLNGTTISPIPSNPITLAGQIGSNTISATANDSCTNDPLSDSENINCACTNDPTVSITGDSESGGVITVTFSTTNISNSGQINFVANGNAIGSKTNLGGGNWSASFNAISGTNNYTVTVTNSCGSDSDTDSTSYVPCVPPTITKINQGVNFAGQFYINFLTTNCTSISAPSAVGTVNCSSSQARWNTTSSNLSWSVTVTNACGSDMISGTFNPCTHCDVSIDDLGCESANEDIDFIFLVDHSGSISISDFSDIQLTIKNTINLINSIGGGSYRYSVAEYHNAGYNSRYPTVDLNDIMFVNNPSSGNHFVNYSQIISAINSHVRYEYLCAYLPYAFVNLIGKLTNNAADGRRLIRRAGAKMHLIIMHDANSDVDDSEECSSLGALYHRNNFLNLFPNTDISVVQYQDGGLSPTRSRSAAIATIGGTWTSPIDNNPSDPQGNPLQGPKRMYYRTSYTGAAMTDLVSDTLQECQLRVNLSSGCPWSITDVEWTTSGGVITEDNGVIISTNGIGSYTATVTLSNGCEVEETYSYPAMMMMRSVNTTMETGEVLQKGVVSKSSPLPTSTKKIVVKKASEYTYDFSGLTDAQEAELLDMFRLTKTAPDPSTIYKNIMTFMNKNVESEYYFSCGCDSGEIDKILNKWIKDGGMEL